MNKAIVFLLCVVVLGSFIQAQSREVANLQEMLKASNATWTAAETNMTRLSMIERQKMLGLLPGISNLANLPQSTIISEPVRVDRFDAPHTSIKDQGNCGSCYSFGACATYESYTMLKEGVTYDLSEQYFMMKAKEIDGQGNGGCNGWWLDTSMDLLKNNKVADEKDCRYLAYEQACSSSISAKHKIKGWAATTDLNTIKNALQQYGLVYVGFAVYNDFFNYGGGIYRYTSGELAGYHAVAIVGFDDANQCFKVKNSWGTGWGENGYFRIGYDQMTNGVEFGTCFGGSFYITGK